LRSLVRREPRTVVVSVKMSERDRTAMAAFAESAGMTLSDYLRSAGLTVLAVGGDRHALRMLLQGFGNTVSELLGSARRRIRRMARG
jgi:hypothetical protein